MIGYVQQIVRATRESGHLALGASPRAGMALVATARALAALDGRAFVLPDDVKQMVHPVLRHRVLPTPEADLEGLGRDAIIDQLVSGIEVPR